MVSFSLEAYRTVVENGVHVNRRLGTTQLPLKEELYVTDLLKFLKGSCCPDQKNRCPFCTEAYEYRNLPRGFKVHFDATTTQFWHSNSTPSQRCASVYVDGGSVTKNKLSQGAKVTLQEGTMIYFRPEWSQRNKLINMEFRVVATVTPTTVITKSNNTRYTRLIRARESAKRSMDAQEEQRKVATGALSAMEGSSSMIDLTQEAVKKKKEPNKSPVIDPVVFATEVDPSLSFLLDTNRNNDPPSSPYVQPKRSGCDPPGSSPNFRSPEPYTYGAARSLGAVVKRGRKHKVD